MITHWLGSIPFGSDALTGPTGQTIDRANTFAEYAVTRGKPVVHEVGEELDYQTFEFFFDETFCDPSAEKARLETALALKTPLPLMLASGGYNGTRFVVDALAITVQHTDRSGRVVRIEATMTLREAPVTGLLGLLASIARGRAPALSGRASTNPNLRR